MLLLIFAIAAYCCHALITPLFSPRH
jgi:hypothetical protein